MNTDDRIQHLGNVLRSLLSGTIDRTAPGPCLTPRELAQRFTELPLEAATHVVYCDRCRTTWRQVHSDQIMEEEAMPLPDWMKPEELWEKVISKPESPDPDQVADALKKMGGVADSWIQGLAAEPGGIFTLLQEAIMVSAADRQAVKEEKEAIADLKGILKLHGFSTAYHYARILCKKNPQSSSLAILRSYCALGAPINPQIALKALSQLELDKLPSVISSLIWFLNALAQQKLEEPALALGSLFKVVELTRQSNFDRLRMLAADLIVELDEIRLGVQGLQIEPTLQETPQCAAALATFAAQKWFQRISQQAVELGAQVQDLIFGLATTMTPATFMQPALLMNAQAFGESHLRGPTVRKRLYFAIVDIPELNCAEEKLNCTRAEPRERLIFSSLPKEYVGRLVFFIVVEAAEMKEQHLAEKIRKLNEKSEAIDFNKLSNDTDDEVARQLFGQSEILNEPDRLISAYQTEIQADAAGEGRFEIVVTIEMEQDWLLKPEYIAILVFR